MIIVRDVFNAKYGKGGELVALMKEAQERWPTAFAERVLTDASGTFFRVVAETSVDSLAAWEQRTADIFSLPEFGDWFARMAPLVDRGRREFWNTET